MIKLSKEQVLMLHTQLIRQSGGSDGIRDVNLLESALDTPFQSFGGEELYEIILAVAAGQKEYEDLLKWILKHQN